MIYRVTIRETNCLGSPEETFYEYRVAYCGCSATEARVTYHANRIRDVHRGVGQTDRTTIFDYLDDANLSADHVGQMVRHWSGHDPTFEAVMSGPG